jgi:alkanesulfonate monooxygenase SsuD/methylene tetrahydromethanopterin reductase-like flavin-dependent oxidoreductase (luciferase family)
VDAFLTGAFGLDAALTHARAAEHHGLGGVWLAEHHFVHYGQFPSATLFAASVLGTTSKLTVGTAACVFSARNPIALAEEAAMLDSLYGDRFQLGVARGGPGIENLLLGGGMDRYETGFPDWLSTLLAELRGTRIVPRPRGPIGVRVAATSMATVETAAKFGLPLLLGVEKTDAEVRQLTERWAELSGIAQADHARVLLAGSPSRESLAAWLARKATRDWTAHIDRLLAIHPVADPLVPRPIVMVEAAGSPGATAELIASLASSNPWSTG